MAKVVIILCGILFRLNTYSQITRTQIMSNAATYTATSYSWSASSSNIKSKSYCGSKYVTSPSWVKVGTNYGMPYCWGGMSTISQHNSAMSNSKSAGDNNCATTYGAGL